MLATETDFHQIFPDAVPVTSRHGFELFAHQGLTLGWSRRRAGHALQAVARDAYGDLFALAAGKQLYRIWNQVPAINAPSQEGVEHYREFNAGRAQAFESQFGAHFSGHLPAASGVGTEGDDLIIAFVAGSATARHFENPDQIPAYRYPAEHGPRAPSFARATVTELSGRRLVFVSGTAAIKGHATVAPHSLPRQIDCTFDNLRLISRAAGLGDDLGAARGAERYFKVYVRPGEDEALVRSRCASELLGPDDDVVWRPAALCRSELKVEIEATLLIR